MADSVGGAPATTSVGVWEDKSTNGKHAVASGTKPTYTSGTSSVSGSSQTYTASGHLLGISNVGEANQPIKNTIQISLSGVEQTYIAVALNNNIIGDEVKIWKGLLNSSNALIADPFLLYYGTIDEFSISDTTELATLSLSTTSHWGQFEKVSGRQTSNNSQQRFFSTDVGMEFSALTVQDIRWGKE